MAYKASLQLEWIDIDVLEGNHPAVTLYEQAGFHRTGFVPDLFRSDGSAIGNITRGTCHRAIVAAYWLK